MIHWGYYYYNIYHNEEFIYRHVKFEIPLRPPGGDSSRQLDTWVWNRGKGYNLGITL